MELFFSMGGCSINCISKTYTGEGGLRVPLTMAGKVTAYNFKNLQVLTTNGGKPQKIYICLTNLVTKDYC